MKNLKVPYLLLFALILSSISYSQQRPLTSIQQNVNEAAHGLEQKLNFTLDTLTLKSTSDILRVTFLDHNAKDSHIIDVGSKEVNIPLYHFKKGRYTIAVYTHDKIIALGANRLNDIPVPKDAVADLEESILRSSLTDEELVSRNIKPLIKKNTRVAAAKPKRNVKKKSKPKAKAKTKEKNAVATTLGNKTKAKETKAKKATPKSKTLKDTRVATVTTKPKQKAKKKSQSNGKSIFAMALEKKEREKKEASAGKKAKVNVETAKAKDAIASNESNASNKPSKPKSLGTIITVKKVTYNLSKIDNDNSVDRQSRAEYRANNLRPNGTAYED